MKKLLGLFFTLALALAVAAPGYAAPRNPLASAAVSSAAKTKKTKKAKSTKKAKKTKKTKKGKKGKS